VIDDESFPGKHQGQWNVAQNPLKWLSVLEYAYSTAYCKGGGNDSVHSVCGFVKRVMAPAALGFVKEY